VKVAFWAVLGVLTVIFVSVAWHLYVDHQHWHSFKDAVATRGAKTSVVR
jgi:hypothetical protein